MKNGEGRADIRKILFTDKLVHAPPSTNSDKTARERELDSADCKNAKTVSILSEAFLIGQNPCQQYETDCKGHNTIDVDVANRTKKRSVSHELTLMANSKTRHSQVFDCSEGNSMTSAKEMLSYDLSRLLCAAECRNSDDCDNQYSRANTCW